MKISDGALCSRVKDVNIKLIDDVWSSIAGFLLGVKNVNWGLKVLLHFHVNYIEESCETYNKRNIIDKTALHHMNLRHGPDGWIFKDENLDREEALAGSSTANFRPKSKFEKFMVRQMNSLNTLCRSQFDKLNKNIAVVQKKLGIQSLDDDDDEIEEVETSDDEEESIPDESNDDILLRDMI
ncbi:hypothetical protein LR48_Vigan01g149300 [Vigna angularis]|uniref:Uncharacterized protein n=1 Tax=Phaseolus angularis TaxID=3914 RepID=A0A0L9TN97_PHAAN|nr:hypothetical protein LR48_Vigan01g149300 [Vigna angularis]